MRGGSLHDYQLTGVNWLRDTWASRRNCILADEMGLGKTIQTAAFCRAVMLEDAPWSAFRPFLVVGPLSTLGNWEREFAVWCPELNVVTLQGNAAARDVIKEYELNKGPHRFDVIF